MKPKSYPVLELAVKDGIVAAWRRAFKHWDTGVPTEAARMAWEEAAEATVMVAITEWFDFDAEDKP